MLAANQIALSLGPMDWAAVALASLAIFAVLGRRLLGDIKRWRAPR